MKAQCVKAIPTVGSPWISTAFEVRQATLCMSRENPRRDRKRRSHIQTYNILNTRPVNHQTQDEEAEELAIGLGRFRLLGDDQTMKQLYLLAWDC
jgi:hypothetical protein